MGNMADEAAAFHQEFEAWLSESMLNKNEMIINRPAFDELVNRIEYKLDRAIYYDDNPIRIELLDDILTELRRIRLGARH